MTAITGAALVTEVESLAKQAGDKYFYGGTSPATGFDCSGIIYDALIQLGVSSPPRTSEEQYAYTTHITKSALQPGDLVFAQFPGDNASPGHVGIYIGNGNVFSAQDPALGIGVSTLASWGSNIVGYGRLPNETTSGAALASTTSASSGIPGIGGILGIPAEITTFFKDLDAFITKLAWLVNPANWIRIGSFLIGVILVGAGIYALLQVGSEGMPA
jgi:hypothetical protein